MSLQSDRAAMPAPSLAAPNATDLFWLFCRVGLSSFGGGTSAWLFREMVQDKRWIAEGEFLDVLALCQALPGINITNLAVWMGRRLLGLKGVLVALTGIVVLPSILIVLIAMLFATISGYPLTEIALTGATAAAVGLPFSMGITVALKLRRAPIPLFVLAATFAAVGIFKFPLIWVVLACGGFSILAEYLRTGRG